MNNGYVLSKKEKILFCKKLSKIRKTKGYSQMELAKAIGYSPSEICHWEHYRRIPPEEIILSVVNELKIDLIEILHEEEFELENKELLRFNSVEEINDAIQNIINSFPSFGEHESIVRYMAQKMIYVGVVLAIREYRLDEKLMRKGEKEEFEVTTCSWNDAKIMIQCKLLHGNTSDLDSTKMNNTKCLKIRLETLSDFRKLMFELYLKDYFAGIAPEYEGKLWSNEMSIFGYGADCVKELLEIIPEETNDIMMVFFAYMQLALDLNWNKNNELME